MTAPGCAEHGQVGEELRLLALALLDRFEPGVQAVLAGLRVEAAEAATAAAGPAAGRGAAGAASGAAGPASGAAAGSVGQRPAACDWCPLCSLIALVRGDRPELAGRLAEQAGGLLSTLRAVLDQPQAGAGPRPRVQRIEVTRVDGGGC